MPGTVRQALPFPDGSYPPDAPQQLFEALLAVEPRLVQWYSSAADRDAKIPTPTKGELAWLNDVELLTVYKTGGWKLAAGGLNQAYGPGTPVGISGGAGTAQVVNTLVVPAAGWDRLLSVTAGCYVDPSNDTDVVDVKLLRGGTLVPSGGHFREYTSVAVFTAVLTAPAISLPASTATTLTMSVQRFSGTGTWATSTDVNLNHIEVLAVPA